MKIYINLFKITFILFLTYGCSQLPGINKAPKNQSGSNKLSNYLTIKDVKIEIIKINNLNEFEINQFNNSKLNELSFSVQNYNNIYDYDYSYVLGSSDVISINLTDTDDIDGSYTIDPNGNIDVPFIGKINVEGLDINKAQDKLISVLGKYYKNPALQIEIEEYNSSKIYILGAVRNQLTINLDQKPIRLIDAAVQADYNPNSQDKLLGSKGLLRRDNQVYKVNLNKVFQSKNPKENFYLKKDDVLFIDRNSDSIQVFGEVSKPGIYFPNNDYSLTELLSTSGLNKLTANAKKIFVIREDYNQFLKINVFELDVSNPVNLILGKRFKLQSKDIVFIPPTKLVQWNRVISLLTPQTELFTSYNPIIQDGFKASSENTTE
ncbi:polysaccharide biosynthesis/export family protein [Candidatus Pelagibacter bacterium]|nr:polysaccharide biosynthesis/export family protein [Candidatus Pelagibacter bacterium]MDA8825593.1 polysaccharide biosynthesis/export family protein [Candidatus Pelagibacter bacterium]